MLSGEVRAEWVEIAKHITELRQFANLILKIHPKNVNCHGFMQKIGIKNLD